MKKQSHITGIMMGYSQVRIRHDKLATSSNTNSPKLRLALAPPTPLFQFSLFSVYGLIIWFGGYDINSGRSSFDDMLKVTRP